MKITKEQLKKIIKEELAAMDEGFMGKLLGGNVRDADEFIEILSGPIWDMKRWKNQWDGMHDVDRKAAHAEAQALLDWLKGADAKIRKMTRHAPQLQHWRHQFKQAMFLAGDLLELDARGGPRGDATRSVGSHDKPRIGGAFKLPGR
jgi:hypothetical protein